MSTPTPDPSRTIITEALRKIDDLSTRVHTAEQASAVMGSAPAELDPVTGFFQLGGDSLMSITLQRNHSASIGQLLSPAVIFDCRTMDSLTAHLATRLAELVEYAVVTEDELLQQLSERLG